MYAMLKKKIRAISPTFVVAAHKKNERDIFVNII